MAKPYRLYLSLHETVDPAKHIIASFQLAPSMVPFEEAAGGVAAESSVGTWTDVSSEERAIWDKLHAKVVSIDSNKSQITVAYPLDLFEPANLPQLLSSIAGNIFGMKEVSSLRLLDLELPEAYVTSFPGPAIGIEGIRKLTGVTDGPLLGSIIKPKLGLTSEKHTAMAMAVFEAGINLVKDDENLTSQSFNPFYLRVDTVTKFMKEKGYLSPGEAKIYAFNITASYDEMEKRAECVQESGGNCHMIDILTIGFAGLSGIRNRNFGLLIHGHRAMHAAFTRSRQYGISMLVIAKLARLAGVDSLHTGTIVGKMEGEKDEVRTINDFLQREWYGLKTVLPTASGGLHPGHIPDLLSLLGKDVLLNFGGGIHGHPKGSAAGARAVVQALKATCAGTSLSEYAQTHSELHEALAKWTINS